MSNFYLCDTCARKAFDWSPTEVMCSAKNGAVRKLVMHDGVERAEELCGRYVREEMIMAGRTNLVEELRRLGLMAEKGRMLKYYAVAIMYLEDGREVYAVMDGKSERWPLNQLYKHGERRADFIYFRSAHGRDEYVDKFVPSSAERVDWGDLAKLYLAREIEKYAIREEADDGE